MRPVESLDFMLDNPIAYVIDYLGEKWIAKNLKKMHKTEMRDGYPTAKSTLNKWGQTLFK